MVRGMVETHVRQVDEPRPRAVVVGVQLTGVSDEAFDASLRELERLAGASGSRPSRA